MSRTKWPGGWYNDSEAHASHYYPPSDVDVGSICHRMLLFVSSFTSTSELEEYNVGGRHCLWCEQAIIRQEQEQRGEI